MRETATKYTKGTTAKIAYSIVVLILMVMGCKKPYYPPTIKPLTGFLVVEGIINAGNDITTFKLSHTVNLDSSTTAPVTDATVTIEGNDNSSYSLTGNGEGLYSSAPLGLNNSAQYRLHIKTTNDEYLSDYVSIKISPSIDTINYQVKSDGVQINLNAHDPTNNTRYYRWNFVETWEFHSEYNSLFYSNGDTVIERPPDQSIYYCYTSDNSNAILLGSSAKLTQDVISTAPITFVPSTSEKIETDYSILVYQYALTSDAYTFWDNLKKNTEQLGSIFDVQPSDLSGNIHSVTNPSEHVIGYISACTVQSKRIFINNDVLPAIWRPTYPYDCELDSALLHVKVNGVYVDQEDIFNKNKGGGYIIPTQAIYDKTGRVIVGHVGSDPICVDCTLRGTVTPPSFW